MKRLFGRWWFWTLAIAGLSLSATALLLSSRQDRITKVSCDRIKKGMALQEVEAILGGPPGDYTAWPHPPDNDEHSKPPPGYGTGEYWVGENGTIEVSFDVNGRVEESYFQPGPDHATRLRWEWRGLLERLKL